MDRENVIKGLECCLGSNDCDIEPEEDCPYKGMCLCAMALHLDVLALLKEQEPVKPRVSTVEQRCGNCNKIIEMDGWIACPWCGRRIDWSGWH